MQKDVEEKDNQLTHQFETVWDTFSPSDEKACFEFSEGYKAFLDNSKTERACANEMKKLAIAEGYLPLDTFLSGENTLEPGSKVYVMNRDKAIILWHIGKKSIKEGMHIVGAHIDAPRLDLKPNPMYEDGDMSFLKTHYYGGVKKYQWTTTPLALHGVVITKDKKKINIVIGEDEQDPIFAITDLLIHLSKDQLAKTMAEGITGESLNVLIGHVPMANKKAKNRVKQNMLAILNEKFENQQKMYCTIYKLENSASNNFREFFEICEYREN